MQKNDIFYNRNDGTSRKLTPHSVALINNSIEFTEALDRSALGRFATDAELLTWMDIYNRSYMLTDQGGRKEIERVVYIETQYVGSALKQDARREASFWRSRSSDDEEVRFAAHTYNQWQHFEVIADSPISFHDYFAVGIWSTVAIASFIEEGIDAELAAKVVNS